MKVFISKQAWQKLCAYVDNCEYEIGGLGKVIAENGNFYVTDLEIFKQKVTAAHVDLTSETLAEFQVEKLKQKETLRDYKFWWHSHAKMGVFWSKTDTDTIDGSNEFPWLVSLVTNHKHELRARVDIYTPVHMYVDNVTVTVLDDVDQAIIDQCKKDIAEKVTVPAPYKRETSVGFKLPSVWPVSDDDATTEAFNRLSKRADLLEEERARILRGKETKQSKKRLKEIGKEADRLNDMLDSLAEDLPTPETSLKSKGATREELEAMYSSLEEEYEQEMGSLRTIGSLKRREDLSKELNELAYQLDMFENETDSR